MGEFSPWHIAIVVLVVLVLFSSKLPGAAKSIGQSLKIFKDETKGLRGGGDEQQAHPHGAAASGAVALPPRADVPTVATVPVEVPQASGHAAPASVPSTPPSA